MDEKQFADLRQQADEQARQVYDGHNRKPVEQSARKLYSRKRRRHWKYLTQKWVAERKQTA